MRATDALSLAWSERQERACAEGRCKYSQLSNDRPSAEDSTECHGWHGSHVRTMRDGAVVSEAIRYHRCPRFVAWINVSEQRKSRRDGGRDAHGGMA